MEHANHNIAIIGKGMIGIGFAALFTGNGIPVTVLAKDAETGYQKYDEIFALLAKNNLVTKEQASRCRKLLRFTDTYSGIADAEIVFECVIENLPVKQEVYALIEENCPRIAAIASASSVISPEDLCKTLKRKELLLVAHPYAPAYLVPCVEVVPSQYTAPQAIEWVCELLHRLKREVIVMKKPVPGFIANRLQHAMTREAFHMVQEGIASPADIDRALRTSFARRFTSVGVFEAMDNGGLDQKLSVDDYIFKELGTETCGVPYLRDLIARGELGVKTGKGIYEWTPETAQDLKERFVRPYLSCFNWEIPEE